MATVTSVQSPDRGGQRFTSINTNGNNTTTSDLDLNKLEAFLNQLITSKSMSSVSNTPLFGTNTNATPAGGMLLGQDTGSLFPLASQNNGLLFGGNPADGNFGVPNVLGFGTGGGLFNVPQALTNGMFNTSAASMFGNTFGFNFPGVVGSGMDTSLLSPIMDSGVPVISGSNAISMAADEEPLFIPPRRQAMAVEEPPTPSRRPMRPVEPAFDQPVRQQNNNVPRPQQELPAFMPRMEEPPKPRELPKGGNAAQNAEPPKSADLPKNQQPPKGGDSPKGGNTTQEAPKTGEQPKNSAPSKGAGAEKTSTPKSNDVIAGNNLLGGTVASAPNADKAGQTPIPLGMSALTANSVTPSTNGALPTPKTTSPAVTSPAQPVKSTAIASAPTKTEPVKTEPTKAAAAPPPTSPATSKK